MCAVRWELAVLAIPWGMVSAVCQPHINKDIKWVSVQGEQSWNTQTWGVKHHPTTVINVICGAVSPKDQMWWCLGGGSGSQNLWTWQESFQSLKCLMKLTKRFKVIQNHLKTIFLCHVAFTQVRFLLGKDYKYIFVSKLDIYVSSAHDSSPYCKNMSVIWGDF